MQASEIIADMYSPIIAQAAVLEYLVLHPEKATETLPAVTAARKLIGLSNELDAIVYNPKSGPLKAALNLIGTDVESAGLPDVEKRREYEFLRGYALSHSLTEEAEEYTGKIARLNGVQHPGHQELSGLDIRI